MTPLWLGIDTGTGGTRALLVDRGGKEVAACTAPHEDIQMEHPLWAEQRPEDWVSAAGRAIRGVLASSGASGRDIRGIGLSGQMHGLVILDRAAQVIRPSLIWCDQRSQPQVDFINETVGREKVLASIANPVLTGFTLPKLLWVRDHEPKNYERVRKVLLPKDYVRFWLTGEFATEVSDASGMALLDVVRRRWSFDMVDALGIDRDILPTVHESTRHQWRCVGEGRRDHRAGSRNAGGRRQRRSGRERGGQWHRRAGDRVVHAGNFGRGIRPYRHSRVRSRGARAYVLSCGA